MNVKRALAVVMVLAALLPAASLLASAFDCGMPCCHQAGQAAKLVPDCCRPAMSKDAPPSAPAKIATTPLDTISIEVTPVATEVVAAQRFEAPQSSPPKSTRLRLASLATLLI